MASGRASTIWATAARIVRFAIPAAAVASAWLIAYGQSAPGDGTAWDALGLALLAAALIGGIAVFARRTRRRRAGLGEAGGWWVAATVLLVLAAALLAAENGIIAGRAQVVQGVDWPVTIEAAIASITALLTSGAAVIAALAARRSATPPGTGDEAGKPGQAPDKTHNQLMSELMAHLAAKRLTEDQARLLIPAFRDSGPRSTRIDIPLSLDPEAGRGTVLGNGHGVPPPAVGGSVLAPGPQRETPGSPAPQRIGDYIIERRLGGGGGGDVFLGRRSDGSLAAVKRIRPDWAALPEFRTRFCLEASAAMRVPSKFTAAVIALDAQADPPWIATEYIAAPSLEALVSACGPLPLAAVAGIGEGCARALEAIHGAGLIHRDLKPSNVLVALDRVCVIDFGIVRATDIIGLTAVNTVIGTPMFMAPEQATPGGQVSPASDVYSLGATLLYAATAHPAYSGGHTPDLLRRLQTEPPDLSSLPAALEPVIASCLHRDPAERPTLAELMMNLSTAITFPPVPADFAGQYYFGFPPQAEAFIRSYQERG